MTEAVHFVVGTGRCGSSLAHEMVCRHPRVDFISNIEDRVGRTSRRRARTSDAFRRLPPWVTVKGRLRFAPSEAYNVIGRQVGPLLVDPYRDLVATDATDALAARTSEFFQAGLGSDRVLVHKFTGWPRARFLHEIFPGSRFVHVVRDPRDVVSSWLRMPWWRGHLGPDGWHFGALDDEARQRWEEHNQSFAVLAALGWQTVIDAAEACRSQLGSGWLDVRYEDLCEDPEGVLARVGQHLGLESTDDWSAEIHRYELRRPRAGSWPELGDDVEAVEAVCARGMATYGYEEPSR